MNNTYTAADEIDWLRTIDPRRYSWHLANLDRRVWDTGVDTDVLRLWLRSQLHKDVLCA